MKYRRFILRNYKAIENIEVNLTRNVIPLIGVNESGKTSILQGVLAFDKDKDHVLDGVHIFAKNKYRTKQNLCEIVAGVVIDDSEEFDSIGKSINLDMNSPLYSWLKGKVDSVEPIDIIREYDMENDKFSNKYKLYNVAEDVNNDKKTAAFIREIINRLPNILYFDDFSDRVPTEIVFNDDLQFTRKKDREWQEIVSEIFSRAIEEEFSLKDFVQINDEDERNNFLSDVTDELNKEIVDEWKKLKAAYSVISDETSELELKIIYEKTEDGKHIFKFKVVDSENKRRERYFSISERSKGFQWFFNFIMKLKFNPKYKVHPENAIYLLDEPGSYLHASAQTELLKKLCSIGENNTIIYCTHSQYLLDPEIINIAGIKIVTKEQSNIKMCDYGDSKVQRSLGAFSALNDALHLKFGFKIDRLRKSLLTEGIVDYYAFKIFLNIKGIEIIPGAGCGQLKELLSILIACSEKYVVILDNDGEGRNAYSLYNSYFEEAFTNNCYQYEGINNKNEDFELENLFDQSDIDMINMELECDDIKRALVLLFYSSKDIKERIKKSLSEIAKKNFNILNERIKQYYK